MNSTLHSIIGTHSTQPKNDDSWAFAVIGDTEDMHEITQRMIDDMRTQSIDFVVHLGDISSAAEATRMTEVRDAFAQLPFPTYYVPGNNDLFFDDTTQERSSATFTEIINQPLNQYINHNNARLLLLDNSYRKYGFRDETLDRLEQALDHTQGAPYTFLFFHRPLHLPLEEVFGDDETATSRPNNERFLNIISKHSITRIFNGHIHIYLPYTLGDIPVTVSGGGGAIPQTILGGASAAQFHYLIVHVPNNGIDDPWVEIRPFQ